MTWNCNLKFAAKQNLVKDFNADILIIQECEELPSDFMSGYKLFWIGNNKKKGLAVIVRGRSAFIEKSFNKDFIYFLPVHSEYGLILGVWSFNHRAMKFGLTSNGYIADTLTYYDEVIATNAQSIISGDFNNNPKWDHLTVYKNNFQYIGGELKRRGFESSYHTITGEFYGDESSHTFFHQRNAEKKFHIDYIFSKGLVQKRCEVGSYDVWRVHSDHVPVIAEFIRPRLKVEELSRIK